MSVEKGKPWERPAAGPADLTVEGDDVALAEAVARHPGARFAFVPSQTSDFARAVGLLGTSAASAPRSGTTELPCDALRVEFDGRELFAVNMVILGVPPDEQRWSSGSARARVVIDTRVVHDGAALAVVVASGQFLRGNDIVPRGHPGDGRAEVQVYSLTRGERRAMRERLPLGVHLPAPADPDRERAPDRGPGHRLAAPARGRRRGRGPGLGSRGDRGAGGLYPVGVTLLAAPSARETAGGVAAKRGSGRSTGSWWPTDTIADPWRRRPKQ